MSNSAVGPGSQIQSSSVSDFITAPGRCAEHVGASSRIYQRVDAPIGNGLDTRLVADDPLSGRRASCVTSDRWHLEGSGLSICERCLVLVMSALSREKSLRFEIEEASKDREFNQSKICALQLKVQECQNIVGTSAQLIRMIGDTNRSTAQNIR